MIDPEESTPMQRMIRARVAAGLCVRCGRANDRAVQACAACQAKQSAKARAWRARNPGYMAAYGKAHRSPDGRAPSDVGRAAVIAAARDPQGVSKP